MAKQITGLPSGGSADIGDSDILVYRDVSAGQDKQITRTNMLNDAVDTAHLVDDAVTGAKIADGSVTNAMLDTTAGELGGEWQTWTTGAITNVTVGNGTVNYSEYTQIGKTVFVRYKLTLGSTSSITGNPTFTPPVSMSSTYGGNLVDAISSNVSLRGSTTTTGVALWATGGVIALRAVSASTSYIQHANISASVPHTWGTGDSISFHLVYEAA